MRIQKNCLFTLVRYYVVPKGKARFLPVPMNFVTMADLEDCL